MESLSRYSFPGNVRELRNLIERATVLAHSPLIQLWDFPQEIHQSRERSCDLTDMRLASAVARAEKQCILDALRSTDGNRTEAADILGISRKNLWEKMKIYQL